MVKKMKCLLILTFLFVPKFALADFEIFQPAFGVMETVQSKVIIVGDKFYEFKQEYVNKFEGLKKDRKNIQDKFNKMSNLSLNKIYMEPKIIPGIFNVNDIKSTEMEIKTNYLMEIGKGDETLKSQAVVAKKNLVITEGASNLFTKASIIRVNIAKEEDQPFERINDQDKLQAITYKLSSLAGRYSNILSLDSMGNYLHMSIKTKVLNESIPDNEVSVD